MRFHVNFLSDLRFSLFSSGLASTVQKEFLIMITMVPLMLLNIFLIILSHYGYVKQFILILLNHGALRILFKNRLLKITSYFSSYSKYVTSISEISTEILKFEVSLKSKLVILKKIFSLN